jgi:hypothetical protein
MIFHQICLNSTDVQIPDGPRRERGRAAEIINGVSERLPTYCSAGPPRAGCVARSRPGAP